MVLPDSPLPGHSNQRSNISNQAANPFTPSASTSENDLQGSLMREEEVCHLRCAAETFDAEKTMAVSGTIVVAR